SGHQSGVDVPTGLLPALGSLAKRRVGRLPARALGGSRHSRLPLRTGRGGTPDPKRPRHSSLGQQTFATQPGVRGPGRPPSNRSRRCAERLGPLAVDRAFTPKPMNAFPVLRAGQLSAVPAQIPWLIEDLWSDQAV